MALNGNDLGDAMRAAVDGLTTDQKRDRSAVFRAMGGAIVTYVTAHAQVTTTVPAAIPVTVAVPAGTGATTAPATATGTIA